jgi:polyphosphate kinase
VLCALSDRQARAQIADFLDTAFDDATAAWDLQPDGTWIRQDGTREDLQESLMKHLGVRSE